MNDNLLKKSVKYLMRLQIIFFGVLKVMVCDTKAIISLNYSEK